MAYTSSQKNAITQLIQFTSCDERTAVKFLKATNWKVEVAADAFFTQGGVPASSPVSNSSSSVSNLNRLFDQYRLPSDPKDVMTVEGIMNYITALGLDFEDPIVFAIAELVQAPSMEEFQRSTFVSGWNQHGADSISRQQNHIHIMRNNFVNDKEYFKRVYLYTYGYALTPPSKALPLETAITCWQCIFPETNHFRKTYLDHWVDFLKTEYKKSISRDTWAQLLEFSVWLEGEGEKGVSEYDEMGAWPSIVDSFVEYLRPKQGISKDDDTWMD